MPSVQQRGPRARRVSLTTVLIAGVVLALPAVAIAQGVLPVDGQQDALLSAGEKQFWSLELESGQQVVVQVESTIDVLLTVSSPDGAKHGSIDKEAAGVERAIWRADSAGPWIVEVWSWGEAGDYSIRWSAGEQDEEDARRFDPFAQQTGFPDDNFGEGTEDAVGEDSAAQALDALLEFVAGTVIPFLAMLALQGVTVFFVHRYMMRSSRPATNPPLPEAKRAGADSEPLAFIDAGSTNGIVLTGDSFERYRHALRSPRRLLWSCVLSLAGFLLASAGVVAVLASSADESGAAGPMVAVLLAQAWLALMVVIFSLGRYLMRAVPLGVGLAIASSALLLLPAGGGALAGAWQGLAIWPLLPLMQWLVLRRGGRRAAALGKQDLLVLRVFGADANAVSTFGTLSQAWRYLGPSITIADPSYVRYEFSAGNKRNRWRMILLSLAFGMAAVAVSSTAVRGALASLPGLDSLTQPQLEQVGRIIAIALLLPLAMLPVFVAVRRRFIKDRDTLLRNIAMVMGQKMRWNGVYESRPYYCYDDLWRPAVQQMMREAEVVLMDLRGFDAANLGCGYEIGEAVNAVPVHRIVLLVDGNTDHEAIIDLFRARWADMAGDSPNAGLVKPVMKVFTATPILTWRDGVWPWLKSLPNRQRRWRDDAERILAFIASAAQEQGAAAIPQASRVPAAG